MEQCTTFTTRHVENHSILARITIPKIHPLYFYSNIYEYMRVGLVVFKGPSHGNTNNVYHKYQPIQYSTQLTCVHDVELTESFSSNFTYTLMAAYSLQIHGTNLNKKCSLCAFQCRPNVNRIEHFDEIKWIGY